jgi:hypothetical protein
VNDIRAKMAPLAIKWAKIGKKTWDSLFPEMGTPKELKEALARLRPILEGSYRLLHLEFKELPESQWETTFAQRMEHLPEYQNLRSAINAFRKDIYNAANQAKQERNQKVP